MLAHDAGSRIDASGAERAQPQMGAAVGGGADAGAKPREAPPGDGAQEEVQVPVAPPPETLTAGERKAAIRANADGYERYRALEPRDGLGLIEIERRYWDAVTYDPTYATAW